MATLKPVAVLPGRPDVRVARSPDPRIVVFQAEDNGTAIAARLVEVTPAGGGGVDTLDRPKQTPLTDWTGGTPEGLQIEMFFDGFDTGTSVEQSIRALEVMAGAFTGGTEPSILIVSGRAIPHGVERASQNRWQISEPLDWGDHERRDPDGDRTRQYVTVTLALVVESESFERVKPRADAPSYRVVPAVANDTFERIAHRELGTSKLAHRLRRLNVEQGDVYFRDWRSVDKHIRLGILVRLPTAKLLRSWKRD